MIECCNIKNIEKKANENIKNNPKEAYNLFSEALNRAQKIEKINLINLYTNRLNTIKSYFDSLKKIQLEMLKIEKEAQERKIKELNRKKEEEEKRRRIELERIKRQKEEEQKRKIEELKRKEKEELERKRKEQLEKEEQERKFKEEQLRKSQKELEDLLLNYLKEKKDLLINLYIRESRLCNNYEIKNKLISYIKNINFNDGIKIKTQIKDIKQNYYLTMKNNKVNHLNIILVGPSGVGKSTLINTILQFKDENQLKTQVGASCTMGKPRYYESPNFKYIRLADSRGIEKNQNYGINEVYKDISEFIKEQEKNEIPDKFVHCIWYCITDSRFEDIEIENIRKLSSIYGGNGNLPVIIVFTKAIYSEFYKGLEKKIQQNNLNINVVPIIAKPFFNKNEEEYFSIPTKGIKKLIELTVENCQKGLENSGVSSINEKIKFKLLKELDDIKRNIELLLTNFNEMKSIDYKKLYCLNSELQNEYDKILINSKTIDINLSNFFEYIIKIEGDKKIDSLINSQIEEIVQYVLEQQLIIYNKYNANFNIINKDTLKMTFYDCFKNEMITQKEFYNTCNYIQYYKNIGLPNIFSIIKNDYNNFFNSYEFLSIIPESNHENYKFLSENIKIESQNLVQKLKKEFEKQKIEWEKNNEISLEKETEIKQKEEKVDNRISQNMDKYKKEDDEIDALFGISPLNLNQFEEEKKQNILNINNKHENESNENNNKIKNDINLEIKSNKIKFYNKKDDNKNIKKAYSIDKLSLNSKKDIVKIKIINNINKENKEENLNENLNIKIKLRDNSCEKKIIKINNKNINNKDKKADNLNIRQDNFILKKINIKNINSDKKEKKFIFKKDIKFNSLFSYKKI